MNFGGGPERSEKRWRAQFKVGAKMVAIQLEASGGCRVVPGVPMASKFLCPNNLDCSVQFILRPGLFDPGALGKISVVQPRGREQSFVELHNSYKCNCIFSSLRVHCFVLALLAHCLDKHKFNVRSLQWTSDDICSSEFQGF